MGHRVTASVVTPYLPSQPLCRCPVLVWSELLCDVRKWHRLPVYHALHRHRTRGNCMHSDPAAVLRNRYALSGTDKWHEVLLFHVRY
eukprot:522579-Rhodomonas_salina.4